ncbi:GMC family oxidoreductase [Salinicola sp. CR57]|uniref:GMC family oxidoreductase n=1 Tax=Salinicola sp. CR57 TaxID=1949086 RepID=UPI001E414D72|nr:GMC family oxidoreductase [Salinicola sp. CR57]
MPINKQPVDVVIIGLGWTGSLIGMEMTDAGLDVVALERGADRTKEDFLYPKPADELKYGVRLGMMQSPRTDGVTIRRNSGETALPQRQWTTFHPGNGVGGCGAHWTGVLYRATPTELSMKSFADATFSPGFLPENMVMQDYGVTYDELEPHFDLFERIAGLSGQAGNLNGEIIDGGNPFEGPRSKPFPLPPLPRTLTDTLFTEATQSLGWHPYPYPSANVSQAYTNPYGMQLGPCNFCGFCSNYGCLNYSKASPQTCVLDALKRRDNFSYRTQCDVRRINKADDGQTVTGVTYIDGDGNEVFQPAKMVFLCSFTLSNVRLLLLSGIGQPYDPISNTGVVGRNFTYQITGSVDMYFERHQFNPFISAGGSGQVIDDFAPDAFDTEQHGFIGGSYIYTTQGPGGAIGGTRVPPGSPSWGSEWKRNAQREYGHHMMIGTTGSNMAYRDCYLDLDPNYRDPHGDPLLRMTYDWKENDMRMTMFMADRIREIVDELGPDYHTESFHKVGDQFDPSHYQSTHLTGGAVMGTDPKTSVVNRYLQHWDAHNLFVMGASNFPQNMMHNPTGTVAALTFWSVRKIRESYLANPGPLMSRS